MTVHNTKLYTSWDLYQRNHFADLIKSTWYNQVQHYWMVANRLKAESQYTLRTILQPVHYPPTAEDLSAGL